ncbi:MAG: O-antigen ligase family protein [Clostridium sp.]
MGRNLVNKLFFIYLCLVPLLPQSINEKVPVMDIFLILIILIYVCKRIINKDDRKTLFKDIINFLKDYTIISMLIVLGVMVLSILVAENKVIVIKESIRFATYICIIFFVIKELLYKEGKEYFINAMYYPAAIVSLLGIIQYMTKIGIQVETNGFSRIESALGHPNSLGIYLVILFFPLIAIINNEKKKFKKLFFIITAIMMASNILLCWSRNSWLAMASGLIILAILYNWKILIGLILGGIGALLVPGIATRVMDMGSKVFSDGRVKHWSIAIKMFLDNPITGVGNGNYTILHEQYVNQYPQYLVPGEVGFPTHNSYLKVLSELGIIGFIPFMLMNCTILYRMYIIFKKFTGEHRGIIIGIITSILIFMQVNMLDNMWFVPKVTTIFWIMAAIIVGVYNKVK